MIGLGCIASGAFYRTTSVLIGLPFQGALLDMSINHAVSTCDVQVDPEERRPALLDLRLNALTNAGVGRLHRAWHQRTLAYKVTHLTISLDTDCAQRMGAEANEVWWNNLLELHTVCAAAARVSTDNASIVEKCAVALTVCFSLWC
jgi:hypothetical protein